MFWFAIDRALHQHERVLLQHAGWRLGNLFLKLLILSRKKIKMLFTGLGRSVLGETLPSV